MKKKIFIFILIILVAAGGFYFYSGNGEEIETVQAERGDLTAEVYETGRVKMGDKVNLSFKSSGKIETLEVEEGDLIEKGDPIARLENEQLDLKLEEAEEAIEGAKAKLDKALAGATAEEISVLESKIDTQKEAIQSAENALQSAEETAENTLTDAYGGVASQIISSTLVVREIEDFLDGLKDDEFSGIYLSQTYNAREFIREVSNSYEELREKRRLMEGDPTRDQKRESLKETINQMESVEVALEEVIDIAEDDFYEDRINKAVIDQLEEMRSNISDTTTKMIQKKDAIEAAHDEADNMITKAEDKLEVEKSSLKSLQEELDEALAGTRNEDVRQARSKLKQAKTSRDMVLEQFSDSVLTSPTKGTIGILHKREGEVAQPGEPVATLAPKSNFQIELMIYEGDIVDFSVGEEVDIQLVPFEETYKGEVVSINPVGQEIDGVVYYKTIVLPDELPEETKIEMTADVTISPVLKEDVVIAPERALITKNGETYFDVVTEDGSVERREAEIGLRERRRLEVISGLKEGDKLKVNEDNE